MDIDEKVKSKLSDLEKLKSDVSEIIRSASGLVFANISCKLGDQIINFIKLFTKEIVTKFKEEDLDYLDQIIALIHNYKKITSELQTSDRCWFKNVVIAHCDDVLFYPNQLYEIHNKYKKISEQLCEKYGSLFQKSFQNVDYDHSQLSDFKQIIKSLKENLNDNEEYKTMITNMIQCIMEKYLYLTREQANHLQKSIKELGDINIEDNEIEINENSTLGSGGFGTVMKGTYLKTSEEVAVKNIRMDRISSSSVFSFLTEIKTMHQIQHPNLLKFVGAKVYFPFRIITQFCSGKSLFDRLHNNSNSNNSSGNKANKGLSADQLTKIAYQVALGMQYLHGKGIVHRDLKTSNILLDEYNNAYVADFGLSGQMKNQEKLISRVGTPNYTAPEILACIHYNSQVDVYSYAIVLWEMMVKRVPFKDQAPDAIYDHVVRNNWRLPLPQESPNGLKKLITQAWSKNPKDRPTFSVIVDWFQKGEIYFTSEDAEGLINEGQINCKIVKNEKHCPHINEEYLMKVLHKEPKYTAYFDSVVEFIVKNMDENIRKKLRDEKILTELAQTPNEYCTSTLLLASALLDEKDFPEFLQNGGIMMFTNALNTHSKESLSGALTFATKIPQELIPQIETSIKSVVNLLGDDNKTPDGIILQLLTRFSYSKVSQYIPYISNFLLNIRLSHIDSQEMFNSFTTLFIHCKKYFKDKFSEEKNDQSQESQMDVIDLRKSEYNLNHFLEFISPKYVIEKDFMESIIEMIGNDSKNLPALITNCILALQKSNLTVYLISLIEKVEAEHSEIFDILVEDKETIDAIHICIEKIKENISKMPPDQGLIEDQKFQAPLLLLFCIAKRKISPPIFSKLEKPDVITSLLEMRKHINQRLQIFTALVMSEQFCKDLPDSRMENIIHLISSSPTSQGQHLSNTALRFILALSVHLEGCLVLEKYDVLDLFVQNFLSSNMDIDISYRIIRNVAKNNVELPQMKIIISCLVQSLLYEMSQKETILDTLVALVKKAPSCFQEKDLQDYILFKLEAPIVALQSLRLLKALKMHKLKQETINNILTHVHQILEKQNYHHPKIINAALAVIKNLINAKINIKNFLDQAEIQAFAQNFLEKLRNENSEYTNIILQVEDFIQTCKNVEQQPQTSRIVEQPIIRKTNIDIVNQH